MGLLTDIVEEQHAKKRQEASTRLDAYKAIVSSPQATDDAKNYAIEQLLHTAGIKGKDHGPMAQMFSHMFGLGKGQQPGQGGPQQGQQQNGPVPAQPGPQAQAPDSLKGADYDPNTKQGTVPISELPLPNKPQAQASAPQQAQQQQPQQAGGMTPMPQQQAGMSSMPQRPQKWFKTNEETTNEQLYYDQKRSDILGKQQRDLEGLRQSGEQKLETMREQSAINRQVSAPEVVLSNSLPGQENAPPWQFSTVTATPNGLKINPGGKIPAGMEWVQKRHADAVSYAKTHPNVSITDAWNKMGSGEVDLNSLKEENERAGIENKRAELGNIGASIAEKRAMMGNISSEIANRNSEIKRRDAEPLGGAESQRKNDIEEAGSTALGLAGADYKKALELIKKQGPGGDIMKKNPRLYGEVMKYLQAGVPKKTAAEVKSETFRQMLAGGKKQGQQGSAGNQSGQGQSVYLKKDPTGKSQHKQGETVEYKGKPRKVAGYTKDGKVVLEAEAGA